MRKETSIYIMVKPNSQKEGYFKGNVFKIGISDDPEKRLLSVDIHETPVKLISEYVLYDRKKAYEIENIIHKMLYCYNLRNEWFYLGITELKAIDNVLTDLFHLECHYYDKSYFTRPHFDPVQVLKECFVNPEIEYLINKPPWITSDGIPELITNLNPNQI